ncbi:MAG: carboxymuconolactone decarboxylase family protein [Burkholderiales bacterium]
MARIPLIDADSNLDPTQKRVAEALLGRRGGRIPGPFRLTLHCPELTEVWHPLGEMLRLKSSFPLRLSEFAIIITARQWDCDYVFQAHAKIALENGLSQSVVDALAKGERPRFEKDDEEALYDYCTELFENHAIRDTTYDRAKTLFGVPRVVELTALIGYYGMVAMTLLAHEMPLPAGVEPPLARRK